MIAAILTCAKAPIGLDSHGGVRICEGREEIISLTYTIWTIRIFGRQWRTNGVYNLDIGTNGVYKQTDIEKVVISRIQNEPLAYRHTSSLPTPDMYVIPSPVTYRASHHPPPQCEIISFRINEFFSSFHDTPKRNASLHSNHTSRPEVV